MKICLDYCLFFFLVMVFIWLFLFNISQLNLLIINIKSIKRYEEERLLEEFVISLMRRPSCIIDLKEYNHTLIGAIKIAIKP